MNNKITQALATGLLSAGLILAGTGNLHAADETYSFSIQTAVPNSSIYFKLVQSFVDRLERMSGGRLQGKVLPDGAEVGAFDILDAVHDGVVEAGYAWPHYWSGKHSAYVLFSNVPASTGMDQQSLMSWYYNGEGQELYMELTREIMGYDTVPFLLQPMGPDPLGWFAKPFESVEEFKRLKYRAPPGIAGQTYNQMGIPAVAMPGGDIVPSAERGTIDAAEWIGPADDRALGLNKIWDYYYLQGLHQQTDIGEIQFNKEFWDSLPADLQAIIETAVLASVAETEMTNLYENAKAVEAYEKEGTKMRDTPEDYYAEFIKAQNVIIQDYIEDDAFFAKVYASQAAFAELVFPYHSRNLELYHNLVQEAEKARQ
ncbi:MAG: TRAP transporter substrate-binding protein [Aquisalimonadaceae bacterium]